MAEKETRNYWSKGGQIYFCDGRAYGLSDTLQTFCLGKEGDILKTLKDKTITDNPVINKILQEELMARQRAGEMNDKHTRLRR